MEIMMDPECRRTAMALRRYNSDLSPSAHKLLEACPAGICKFLCCLLDRWQQLTMVICKGGEYDQVSICGEAVEASGAKGYVRIVCCLVQLQLGLFMPRVMQ